MKNSFPPVIFLTSSPTSLPPARIHHASEANAKAFRWLLALGFPPEVAAARVMPELFADSPPARGTTAPFLAPIAANRAA